MIVYRDRRTTEDTARYVADLLGTIRRWPAVPTHEQTVDVLIRVGMLEAAVVDARYPDRDDVDEIGQALREAAVCAGHLVRSSWRGSLPNAPWLARLEHRLAALPLDLLPARIALEVPEGYAQYGLFPECYLDAAARCFDALGPGAYVCLGLRSIGTSLSAVVAAELESRGATVRSYTLRPRGHAFERRIHLGAELARELASSRNARALVIDEGPGISGSSMAGTADTLAALGYADSDIAFLPSWDPDPQSLRSAGARERWSRHRRFTVGFEETWVRSGRLESELQLAGARDLSAGAWRAEFLRGRASIPAVHPHHERRKYLAGQRLAAFSGLGGLAGQRAERASSLAEAGFVPSPLHARHGFVTRTVTRGEPLTADVHNEALLNTVAAYVSHLRCRCHAVEQERDQITQMVDVNVAEALGPSGQSLLARHRGHWGSAVVDRPIALDGRMMPHEWLLGPAGYLKVDALDHHDDHFFPGPQDIAWDLAGVCVEFALDDPAASALIERYRRLSHDRTIGLRLPAYMVAYLAFRTGYATMAAETLRDSPDGRRFGRLAASYRTRLTSELNRRDRAPWSA